MFVQTLAALFPPDQQWVVFLLKYPVSVIVTFIDDGFFLHKYVCYSIVYE